MVSRHLGRLRHGARSLQAPRVEHRSEVRHAAQGPADRVQRDGQCRQVDADRQADSRVPGNSPARRVRLGATRLHAGLQGLKDLVRRWRPRALPPPGPGSRRASTFGRLAIRRIWLTSAILELVWFWGGRVRWWQRRGHPVICDRSLADALVDVRVYFPQERVERWWCWRLLAWVAPHPDAAFMLLVPPAESARRRATKQEPFPDTAEMLDRRWAEYGRLAKDVPWVVLDGRRSVQELSAKVREELGLHAHERGSTR